MSKSPPEPDSPVRLRVSNALSLQREQTQAPGNVAAGQLNAPVPETGAEDDGLLMTPAFAAAAVGLLLGGGWLVRRRQRLVPRPQAHAPVERAAVEPVEVPAGPADPADPAAPPLALPPATPVNAAPTADEIAELASQFEDEPGPLQPQQTFPAPLEHQHRPPSRIGVASQKRLIRSLMWVRTLAGGAALVAAIAVVVFWSIELIDHRSGDTGLTKPLLLLVLVAWAAFWGAGQLANQLHRMFFGRVHPKFDT